MADATRDVEHESPERQTGPMYLQVSDDLRSRIDHGEFTTAGQLPSYNQICREYKISEITARRAITLLREDGRVYTEKGRGIFVRKGSRYRIRVMQPRTFAASGHAHDPVAFVLFDLYDGIRHRAHELGVEIARYSRMSQAPHPRRAAAEPGQTRGEGLIFLHEHGFERELALAAEQERPYVVAEGLSPAFHRVAIDMEAGAYDMTRYLLAQGHSQIAYLGKSADNPWYAPRLAGYTRALRDASIASDSSLIGLVQGYDPMESDALVGQWLRCSGDSKPTAVFAANDVFAVHTLDYLRLRGIRVPGEVSVAGYDNAPESSETHPSLTTVDAPRQLVGAEAVTQLIRLMDGDLKRISKVVKPRVVVRDSVGSI